jgi:hypothetical protein
MQTKEATDDSQSEAHRTSKAITTLEVDIDPNEGINHTNTEY